MSTPAPLTLVLVALLACATASAASPAPAPERPSRKALVRRILPHNVRVLVREGEQTRRASSGVVVAAEALAEQRYSYVVTNAHAVEEAQHKGMGLRVAVEQQWEVVEYPAEVVAMGQVPDLDLALVRVQGVQLPPARLAEDAELELGEEVVVAAAPYGRALSLSGGMVSQVQWDPKTRQPLVLKTDAPIGYGASGGGIYSLETGRLLAIVEGYRTAKVDFSVAEQRYSFDVPMPGETFAAPSTKVRAFLVQKGFGRLLLVATAPAPRREARGRTQASAAAAAPRPAF